MVGDGSYLMLNSEIATSVMMGLKLIIILLDNRGYGCINRLQQASGGQRFNNLLPEEPRIDFVAHAQSLGARAERVMGVEQLQQAASRALESDRTYVVLVETDPESSTEAGGAWWDVAIPEVSDRAEVRSARAQYEKQIGKVRP